MHDRTTRAAGSYLQFSLSTCCKSLRHDLSRLGFALWRQDRNTQHPVAAPHHCILSLDPRPFSWARRIFQLGSRPPVC